MPFKYGFEYGIDDDTLATFRAEFSEDCRTLPVVRNDEEERRRGRDESSTSGILKSIQLLSREDR